MTKGFKDLLYKSDLRSKSTTRNSRGIPQQKIIFFSILQICLVLTCCMQGCIGSSSSSNTQTNKSNELPVLNDVPMFKGSIQLSREHFSHNFSGDQNKNLTNTTHVLQKDSNGNSVSMNLYGNYPLGGFLTFNYQDKEYVIYVSKIYDMNKTETIKYEFTRDVHISENGTIFPRDKYKIYQIQGRTEIIYLEG